jgi:hypothetical protein
LRRCLSAKYFRKNDSQYYFPCSHYDEGALKISLNEIPEPEYLLPPDVCVENYLIAMSKIKATVSEKDLLRLEEFSNEFGSD